MDKHKLQFEFLIDELEFDLKTTLDLVNDELENMDLSKKSNIEYYKILYKCSNKLKFMLGNSNNLIKYIEGGVLYDGVSRKDYYKNKERSE